MRDGGGGQKRASLTASQAGDFECHHLQSAPPKAHTKRHTHTRTRTPKQQTEASDTEARLAGWLAWALLGAAEKSKPTAQRVLSRTRNPSNSKLSCNCSAAPFSVPNRPLSDRVPHTVLWCSEKSRRSKFVFVTPSLIHIVQIGPIAWSQIGCRAGRPRITVAGRRWRSGRQLRMSHPSSGPVALAISSSRSPSHPLTARTRAWRDSRRYWPHGRWPCWLCLGCRLHRHART